MELQLDENMAKVILETMDDDEFDDDQQNLLL